MRGAGHIQAGSWSLTTRVVLVDTDRAPLEFSLAHRLRDDLQVGIEYNVEEEAIFPLINWRVMDATKDHPALVVGVGSAWPSNEVDGSALFITAAQNIAKGLSLSASLSYGIEDHRVRAPGSLRYVLGETLSTTLFYDGDNLHPLLTYRTASTSYSLIFLGARDPAISISWGF